MSTARAADEARAERDDAGEGSEVVEAHCQKCSRPREVPKVREVVKFVRGRKVVKHFVGPFQI